MLSFFDGDFFYDIALDAFRQCLFDWICLFL